MFVKTASVIRIYRSEAATRVFVRCTVYFGFTFDRDQ